MLNGGADMSPCLLMLGEQYSKWGVAGTFDPLNAYTANNYLFYQVFGSYKATPKLNLAASLSYATADRKPAGYVSDVYGTEIDVTASYKIYDNLTYEVGLGYLWAGDYYKGSTAKEIDNNYVVMNKLQVKF